MRHFVKSLGAHLSDTVTKVSEEFFHGAEPEIDGPGHDGSYVIEWDTAQAEGPRGDRVPMQVVEDELRRAGARVIHAENRGSRYHVALQPGNKFLRRKALRKAKFLARRAKGLPGSGRKFIDLGPILAAIASNAHTLNHMLRPDTWRQGYDYVRGLIREGLDAVGPKSPETERSVRDAERQLMEAADDWFDNEVIPVVNQYHPDNVVGPKAQQLIAWIQRKLQGKSLPGRLGKSLTITFAKGSVLQGRKGRGWKRCHRQKFLPSDPLGLVPLLMNTSYQVIPLLVEGSIRQAADLIASALQRAGIGVEASDIKPLLEERQGQVGAGPRQLMEGLARDLNEAQGKALLRYRVKSLTGQGRKAAPEGGQDAEWQTNGRWYRRQGGVTSRISGPGGQEIPDDAAASSEEASAPPRRRGRELAVRGLRAGVRGGRAILRGLRRAAGALARAGSAAREKYHKAGVSVANTTMKVTDRVGDRLAGANATEEQRQQSRQQVHDTIWSGLMGMLNMGLNAGSEFVSESGAGRARMACSALTYPIAWAYIRAKRVLTGGYKAPADTQAGEQATTDQQVRDDFLGSPKSLRGRKAWHKDLEPAAQAEAAQEIESLFEQFSQLMKVPAPRVDPATLEVILPEGASGGKRLRRKSFRRGTRTQGR